MHFDIETAPREAHGPGLHRRRDRRASCLVAHEGIGVLVVPKKVGFAGCLSYKFCNAVAHPLARKVKFIATSWEKTKICTPVQTITAQLHSLAGSIGCDIAARHH